MTKYQIQETLRTKLQTKFTKVYQNLRGTNGYSNYHYENHQGSGDMLHTRGTVWSSKLPGKSVNLTQTLPSTELARYRARGKKKSWWHLRAEQ